jgi:hypothetical protein
VKVAPDFTPRATSNDPCTPDHREPPPVDDSEARLAYVAVTRARQRLDIGGLAWAHPQGR